MAGPGERSVVFDAGLLIDVGLGPGVIFCIRRRRPGRRTDPKNQTRLWKALRRQQPDNLDAGEIPGAAAEAEKIEGHLWKDPGLVAKDGPTRGTALHPLIDAP